jgi:hypothetical protein
MDETPYGLVLEMPFKPHDVINEMEQGVKGSKTSINRQSPFRMVIVFLFPFFDTRQS